MSSQPPPPVPRHGAALRDADPADAVARARAELQRIRAALSGVTGGAPPRVVLAELAQGLAAELATYFDQLPMHAFTGRVPRVRGAGGWLLPTRGVPHRMVSGRYLITTVPQPAGGGLSAMAARIALVALGADGVLRRGESWEGITLSADTETTTDALPWDDQRLRRVPTRALRLTRWGADAESAKAASPAEVLDALTRIATAVADVASRELALLDRLLGPSR